MSLSVQLDNLDLNLALRRLKIQPRINERVFEFIPKYVSKTFLPLTAFAAITIFFIIIQIVVAQSLIGGLVGYTVVTVIMGLMYLALSVYIINEWYCFRQSAVVITNQRIIEYDHMTIFSHLTPEIDIRLVKNAAGKPTRILGRFLNYGLLTIELLGGEAMKIDHLAFPELVAKQVMHFHNVVTHGSADKVYNYKADEVGKERAPVFDDKKSVKILQFEAPSEKVGNLLKKLPAETEPQINFLAPQDTFEIEAIVLDYEADRVQQQLTEDGAQDMTINGAKQT